MAISISRIITDPPQFFKDKKGSIAPIFAIALIPIVISAGAAMDYSRMAQDSTAMQNAIDSAVLAGGRDLTSKSKSQVKQLIQQYLKANLENRLYSQVTAINIDMDKSEKTITASLKGETPTTILGVIGKSELKYNLVASTKAASGTMEIVMVLDNTYSMSVDNKLVDLKAASTSFITQLMENNKHEKVVKIGIVPFSQYVNVGLDNRRASWMDVPDDSTSTVNRCYMKRDILTRYNCRDATRYNDGVPYTYQQCSYTYGPRYEVCGPSTRTYTWRGCVGSRQSPLNLKDTRPNKRFPGLLNRSCPSRLTELTYTKKKLTDQISAMRATGQTYIPTGLMWGMRVLSAAEPFTQGTSYPKADRQNVKKVIMLMTDGENQRSAQLPRSAQHNGKDLNQANSWTTSACNEIKDKEISLYTVTFGPSIPADAKTLIRNCATNASQYFHATSGDDLKAAFEEILDDLNQLRLTH